MGDGLVWHRIGRQNVSHGQSVAEWCDACCTRDALREIVEKDGPGLDLSPPGPCHEIAEKALHKTRRSCTCCHGASPCPTHD